MGMVACFEERAVWEQWDSRGSVTLSPHNPFSLGHTAGSTLDGSLGGDACFEENIMSSVTTDAHTASACGLLGLLSDAWRLAASERDVGVEDHADSKRPEGTASQAAVKLHT